MKTAVKKAVNSKGEIVAVVVEKEIYALWKLEPSKKWKPMRANMNRCEAFSMFDRVVH